MKKFLFLPLFIFISTAGTLMAQQTSIKAVNTLTKETYLKLRDEGGIPSEQLVKTNLVFEDFYTEIQRTIAEMRTSGSNTAEEITRAWRNLSAVRDERLIKIFTEEEMAKWQKIEPSLRLQRIKEEQKD